MQRGRWISRLAIGACAAAITAGCVSPPPEPQEIRKQALGEVQLDGAWKSGAAAQGTVQDNWLATFGDSTLDALVREALTRNPDLRVASARMRQAGELSGTSQALS